MEKQEVWRSFLAFSFNKEKMTSETQLNLSKLVYEIVFAPYITYLEETILLS